MHGLKRGQINMIGFIVRAGGPVECGRKSARVGQVQWFVYFAKFSFTRVTIGAERRVATGHAAVEVGVVMEGHFAAAASSAGAFSSRNIMRAAHVPFASAIVAKGLVATLGTAQRAVIFVIDERHIAEAAGCFLAARWGRNEQGTDPCGGCTVFA